MNTMTISSKGFAGLIKRGVAVILITAALTSPSVTYGQSQDDGYDDEPAASSSTNAGPWQNSAGATVGTRDNGSGAVRQAVPAIGPGGGSLNRPAAGPTPDATGGPGGNPDVPFDASMNIMFLATGLVFAYVVYRRRLKLKPVIAEKN